MRKPIFSSSGVTVFGKLIMNHNDLLKLNRSEWFHYLSWTRKTFRNKVDALIDEWSAIALHEQPNDQAERLAVNARKPETETVKPTQTAEPQACSQFAPATLLGDVRASSLRPTPSTVCGKDQCLRENEQYQPVLDTQKHPANLVTPESMADRESRLGTLPSSWMLQNRSVSINL